MKMISIRPASLVQLVFVLLISDAGPALAEKIWTNSASGFWSNGTNWTGHTPPDDTAFLQITNANSKTITLDANTAATNLTVQSLTLSAPPGATNLLLLSNVGTNTPLTLQSGLDLQDGAAIWITNSALVTQLMNDHVNLDGQLILDSGFIDFGDTTVTARVGRVTSGVLTMNGGALSAGTMTVGGLTNSTGTVNLNGGSLTVAALLSVGRNQGTLGSFQMSGGQLLVPNLDTRVGDEGTGQMIITNSTASLTNLQVGRDALGTLTLQSGGLIQVLSDVDIARFFDATGVVAVAGGQLQANGYKIYAGRGGNGQLDLSSGKIQAAAIIVAGDSTNSAGATGLLTVEGGSLILSSNLWIGGTSPSSAQTLISGGAVAVTNAAHAATVSIPNGTLTLGGGLLTADNLLLTNASGQFSFVSGALNTRGTTVANGTPFVVGDGTHSATLHLNGGTHTFASGLVISSNATLEGCGTLIGNIVNHGTISTNCGSQATFSIRLLERSASKTLVSFPSELGATYVLQYKNSLSDPAWTPAGASTNGTGTTIILSDSAVGGQSRFYRVSQQ